MEQQFGNIKIKYLLTGLIIGLIISLLLALITIHVNNYSFSISSLIILNKKNPINFILIIFPIISLSLIGYISGANISKAIFFSKKDKLNNKQRIENIFDFVESIRKGKVSFEKERILSKDKVGKSLINLKNEIEKNKKINKSSQEEEIQRHWISEGLALFGAILRENNDSIETLAKEIISELVKYTDTRQAGFYIINDKDKDKIVINEIANFAYNKERLANKEILWGEGAIGACIIEKKTTLLKNIDKNYTKIESGLGSSAPRNIIIVPLMTEEGIVHGAIELASFKDYKEFEIEFIEQVAESIATTISSIKINEETTRLLEESKQFAETMTTQENELRKIISDMERLQANADIQSTAFRAYQESTNKALISAEFTIDGKLLFANKKFIKTLGYKSNSEITNVHISKFIHANNVGWFSNEQENIISNKHFEGLLNYSTKDGRVVWIESSYIGLNNDKGKVEKILFLGLNVTDLILQEKSLSKKINTFEDHVLKIDVSTNDKINAINNNLLNLINYSKDNIIDKEIINFIDNNEANNLKTIIDNVKNSNQKYEGEFSILNSENIKIWLHGVIYQNIDINNNLENISVVAFNSTESHTAKQKALELTNIIEDQNNEILGLKERIIKRVEQAKEEMKEVYIETETANLFYEETLKSIPNPIISIDSDNVIHFINPKAILLLNASDINIKKDKISTIFPKLEKDYNGIYLGDLLNYETEKLPIGEETEVFIIDKEGKQAKYKAILNESIIGLRKRLTAIIYKIS